MSLSKIVLTAFVASFLSAAAYAESTPASNPPTMGTMGAMGGHSMMRGMFTDEERMVLFADMSKATVGMTDDQKHAYRHGQRDRIMAMSDTDRAKFKADLASRWNALPADQKAAMTAQMQAHMAEHHDHDHDGDK
jgi:hypothetical protein